MSLSDSGARPSKRVKMDNLTNSGPEGPPKAKQGKTQDRASKLRGSNSTQGSRGRSNYRSQAAISASGIHNDDVGIFVTSDKGQEKKCLQELADLLGEFFDDDLETKRPEDNKDTAAARPEKEVEVDIEADISAELDSLRPQAPSDGGVATLQKLSLVTLDIPCVSFVRFPAQTSVDPVQVVRKLCFSASSKDASGPRSRYIKRLTPVSLVRKTLNDGLEALCNQILPKDFLIDSDDEQDKATSSTNGTSPQTPCKFAIRPTIRNNNKIDRDQVIRTVADKIQALGQDKHKVDLKGYDKLVLVDVYRNVVGMSVVGNEYDKLKRFNLAEIHATHLEEGDVGKEAHQKGGT